MTINLDHLLLFLGKSDKGRPCQPIFKVQWLTVSSGYVFVFN